MGNPNHEQRKGLHRVENLKIFIAEGFKELQIRNNSTKGRPGIVAFVANYTTRLSSFNFNDLHIKDFKPLSDRSHINYYLILNALVIKGKGRTKTSVLNTLGLSHGPGTLIINQFISHGYIKLTAGSVQQRINGRFKSKPADLLQLTGKGYDQYFKIINLLMDDRLI